MTDSNETTNDMDRRPTVLTVVSCGTLERDFGNDVTIQARLLYTGKYACKDGYGLKSDGYYIVSPTHGLVHNLRRIAPCDKAIGELSDVQAKGWARRVTNDLEQILTRENYDAVVFLCGESYIEVLKPHFDRLSAAVLTPWQTHAITGSEDAAQWCNDDSNWPANISSLEDIGTVVSEGSA